MQMRRILLVHNFYQQPGGEDTQFYAEREILRQNGHEIIEFTDHNHRINEMNRLSAAVKTVWSPTSRKRLRTLLRETKPTIAHFHNTFFLISPSVYSACKEAGVPVVQTLQNYRLICPGAMLLRDGRICEDCVGKVIPWPGVIHGCWRGSPAQTAVVATMLGFHNWFQTWQTKVDIYIALTEFARRKFIEGGLPAQKIMIKPNCVAKDPLPVESHDNWGSKRDYALYIGRLSPEKGLGTLLRAWQRLESVPLKIVGDGPLKEKMRASIVEHVLKAVELLGHRPLEEVFHWMGGARFLVFPSQWYEGLPLTITEAFACGLPVIASRLGAMAEIVEDQRTGLLFTPGDAEDLAAKVEWAWSHPKAMARMGQEARREYETKYTAEQNYEMLMAIYRRALNSA